MDLKAKNNPQLKQGYLYAVRLLTASKKSTNEIVRRLTEKGYPNEVAKQVIHELKTQGILSDQKLIAETIQLAAQVKRYGRKRIFLQLRRKGIAANEIEKALQEYPKTVERETAYTLAQERWAKLDKVELKKRTKRLYDFLLNRGFDFELCREVVNKIQSTHDENY